MIITTYRSNLLFFSALQLLQFFQGLVSANIPKVYYTRDSDNKALRLLVLLEFMIFSVLDGLTLSSSPSLSRSFSTEPNLDLPISTKSSTQSSSCTDPSVCICRWLNKWQMCVRSVERMILVWQEKRKRRSIKKHTITIVQSLPRNFSLQFVMKKCPKSNSLFAIFFIATRGNL